MDAAAILRSQGWRGAGHSLHATSDSIGLKHHLLVSRNADGRGLGHKNKSEQATAWWLNAFDQALKGNAGALETVTRGKLGKYTGNGGLYGSFIKGGLLEGTIQKNGLLTPPCSGLNTPAEKPEEQARKESKHERRARKEARRLQKAERKAKKDSKELKDRKASKSDLPLPKVTKLCKRESETKEERRARRDARRNRKEEKRKQRAVSAG